MLGRKEVVLVKTILSNLPAIVVCFGAMLSAIGAVWLAMNQSNDDRILREKSEEIAALAKQNATLAQENAAVNKELVSLLTGGDSYCYLLPGFNVAGDAARRGHADIEVLHSGKYPLYDVRIRVVDLQKFRQIIGDSSPPGPITAEKLGWEYVEPDEQIRLAGDWFATGESAEHDDNGGGDGNGNGNGK